MTCSPLLWAAEAKEAALNRCFWRLLASHSTMYSWWWWWWCMQIDWILQMVLL